MIQNAIVPFAELKFSANETGSFSGYASVFNVVDSQGDMILPGAFAETLAEARKTGRWPPMLVNHGFAGGSFDFIPVGVWTDMAEDGRGLYVEGKFADTERGREIYQLMKMQPRPAMDGLSIGYYPKKWTAGTKPKEPRRKIESIDLIEISIVTLPANPKARVSSVKQECVPTVDFVSALLRNAGFSESEAKCIAMYGVTALQRKGTETEIVSSARRLLDTLRSLGGRNVR